MERAFASARLLWQQFTLTRYLMASIVALAFDIAIYWMAISLGSTPSLASAVGYCFGIIVHWMVSTQYVFVGKRREGTALQLQRALFAGSALVGLAITVGVVTVTSAAGATAMIAKGVAVIISFLAVYGMRKWGVFR